MHCSCWVCLPVVIISGETRNNKKSFLIIRVLEFFWILLYWIYLLRNDNKEDWTKRLKLTSIVMLSYFPSRKHIDKTREIFTRRMHTFLQYNLYLTTINIIYQDAVSVEFGCKVRTLFCPVMLCHPKHWTSQLKFFGHQMMISAKENNNHKK